MPHPRQLIREAVCAQLVAADTAAESRVFETRIIPIRQPELPAIAVYTLEESVEESGSAPRELKRVLQLMVEGAATGADIDDTLDDLALEIERAMHSDETFGGTASDALMASTDVEILEQGQKLIGVVRIVYQVTYYTHAPEAADVPLDNFNTFDVHTSLSGDQAVADQAHDFETGINPPEE
jgi:hypothetical protein